MLSGTCGENLTWTLDSDTLTISGAGDMEEYNTFSKDRAPWFERRDLIKRVVIADGVTRIGLFAFEYCKNLTEVKIPASVTYLGEEIFDGCTRLEKIYYKAGSGFEDKLRESNDAELIPY